MTLEETVELPSSLPGCMIFIETSNNTSINGTDNEIRSHDSATQNRLSDILKESSGADQSSKLLGDLSPTSHINDLPYEVLVYIFLFINPEISSLHTLSRVCHTWQFVSYANILWQRVYKDMSAQDVIRHTAILLKEKTSEKNNVDLGWSKRSWFNFKRSKVSPSLSFSMSPGSTFFQDFENSFSLDSPVMLLRLLDDRNWTFDQMKQQIVKSQREADMIDIPTLESAEEEEYSLDDDDDGENNMINDTENQPGFYRKCSQRLLNCVRDMNRHRLQYVALMNHRCHIWCLNFILLAVLLSIFAILFSVSTSAFTKHSMKHIILLSSGWEKWCAWWTFVFSPLYAIPCLAIVCHLTSLLLVIKQRSNTLKLVGTYFNSVDQSESKYSGLSQTHIERLTNMTTDVDVKESVFATVYSVISWLLILSSLIMLNINAISYYYKQLTLDDTYLNLIISIPGWLIILPMIIWTLLTWLFSHAFVAHELIRSYLQRRFRFQFDPNSFMGNIFRYSDERSCLYIFIFEAIISFCAVIACCVWGMAALTLHGIVEGWTLVVLPLCFAEAVVASFAVMIAAVTVSSHFIYDRNNRIPVSIFFRCVTVAVICSLFFAHHIMLSVGVDALFCMILFVIGTLTCGIWAILEVIQYHSFIIAQQKK